MSKLPVLRSKIMALTICLHLHFQGSCCGLWPATSAPMMRMVWRGAGEVGRCWKVPRKFSVSSGVDEDPMRRGISPARSFPCPGVSEAAAMVPGGQTGGGYCYQAGIQIKKAAIAVSKHNDYDCEGCGSSYLFNVQGFSGKDSSDMH